jgi:hypothetical protein
MRQAAFSGTVLRTEKVRRYMQEVFGWGKTEVVDEKLEADFVCHDSNGETGESKGAATTKDHRAHPYSACRHPPLPGPSPCEIASGVATVMLVVLAEAPR